MQIAGRDCDGPVRSLTLWPVGGLRSTDLLLHVNGAAVVRIGIDEDELVHGGRVPSSSENMHDTPVPSGGLTAQAPQAVAWAISAATMDRSKQTSYPQASKQSSKGSRHRRRV
jgi:hypothetical protein